MTFRRPKYGNTRVLEPCAWGYSHRSKFERAVCDIIRLRVKAGELEHVAHEKHVRMGEGVYRVTYVADFLVRDRKTGEEFFIEAKGSETREWLRKLKVYRVDGPAKLEIWKGSWQRPKLVETVLPKKVTEGAA